LPIAYTASYSDRGRMDSLTSSQGKVSYRYNALEQRISKSGPEQAVPGGAVHYVYDEQGHVLGEYDAKGNPLYEVVWLNDQPLAVIRQSRSNAGGSLNVTTDVDYIYADHLDTPRLIVRASGDHAIVWRWDIPEPFGNAPADDNPNKLGRYRFNLRLPGQVFDSESALHYNHHRDYDAYLGRYVQPDPIGLLGGINTFSYVWGNPLRWTDPTGKIAIADDIIIGGGIIIIGCALSPGCRQAINDAAQACGHAIDSLVFNRPKNPPDVGPPNGWIEGPRRGRQYGPDGRPAFDIDKPHQGNEEPHAHEWPGGQREEPGRPVSPWPSKP
jgi:RHS repeat-associated protein